MELNFIMHFFLLFFTISGKKFLWSTLDLAIKNKEWDRAEQFLSTEQHLRGVCTEAQVSCDMCMSLY